MHVRKSTLAVLGLLCHLIGYVSFNRLADIVIKRLVTSCLKMRDRSGKSDMIQSFIR